MIKTKKQNAVRTIVGVSGKLLQRSLVVRGVPVGNTR